MARLFRAPQAQGLFQRAKEAEPVAQKQQQAEESFQSAIEGNLVTRYKDFANQYEKRTISDTQFSKGVTNMVNNIKDRNLQVKWSEVANQARYLALTNQQELEDIKIRSGVASGAISESDAIKRYEAMADAAQLQDSNNSIRDAESWRLKANMIKESQRSRGPGPSKEISDEDKLKAVRLFEANKSSYKADKDLVEAQIEQMTRDRDSGETVFPLGDVDYSYREARDILQNSLAGSLNTFIHGNTGFITQSLIDEEGVFSYLDEQVNYLRQRGVELDLPDYITSGEFYESDLPSTRDIPPSVLDPNAAPVVAKPFTNRTQEAQPSIPTPIQTPDMPSAETQRRSNPLFAQ